MAIVSIRYSDPSGPHNVKLDRASTSIGRSLDEHVVLRDPCVSRHHAVIVREGETYTVIDQNSRYGTFLNNRRIERSELAFGDVLQMGSVDGIQLRFDLEQANETTRGRLMPPAADLLSALSELRPHAPAMEKLNWLLRAARQLNEGGPIEDILSAFLHLTLQLTGMERGFVFFLEDDEMRLALGFHASGKMLEEDSTISRQAIRKALESESKFSISDTSTDNIAAGWSSVMANSISSICCIPLRKHASVGQRNKHLGLLYLDSHKSLRDLTKLDHQLLDTIAAEAAALLHNAVLSEAEYKARQAREELALAAQIHSGLMSMALPELAYANIRAQSIPCLAIGGDFYDAVALENSVYVVFADVSGKGISAAIVAATLQGIVHSQFFATQPLSGIAALVNYFLCTRKVGKYATMVLLQLFPDGNLEYMNCGHIPPLAVLGTQIRRLEESSLVVGLIAGATYTSAHYKLQPGERLLLVSDGVTEAEDIDGNQFGDSGLEGVVTLENLSAILDRVTRFHAPNPAQDDCTLLEIQYTGGT
jgi:phosphoserine phosphatase RsbU/P